MTNSNISLEKQNEQLQNRIIQLEWQLQHTMGALEEASRLATENSRQHHRDAIDARQNRGFTGLMMILSAAMSFCVTSTILVSWFLI